MRIAIHPTPESLIQVNAHLSFVDEVKWRYCVSVVEAVYHKRRANEFKLEAQQAADILKAIEILVCDAKCRGDLSEAEEEEFRQMGYVVNTESKRFDRVATT